MSASPSPAAPDFPALLNSFRLRWTVRVCAGVAAALCAWLTWLKFSGQVTSLAGCGGEGGCQQVLGGRWSSWMGLPVSLLALGLYLSVLLLTLRPVQNWLYLQADRLLCAAGIMAILAAAWFIGILAVREREFCPYCAAAHTLGLGFAVPLLITAWRVRGGEGPGFVIGSLSVAVPAFAVLVLGQVFGPQPDTHQITREDIKALPPPPVPQISPQAVEAAVNPPPAANVAAIPPLGIDPAARVTLPESAAPPATAAPKGRVAGFFKNEFRYGVEELPLLGEQDAEFVMVEYFDYTCRSCRDMAGDLKAMRRAFENKFAVVLLPCPLNRKCNPYLPASVRDEEHAGACELAQLALAVWRAAPQKFPAFHDALLAEPLPVDVAKMTTAAEAHAGGRDALTKALTDPWIKQRLSETMNQYRLFSAQNIRMPKLLLRDETMMHGPASSEEVFLNVLRQQFGVK